MPPQVLHLPMRPLWRCRTCRSEWPCPRARAQLLAEYHDDGTALLIYLAATMVEAGTQLRQLGPPGDAAALADRFLTWARRPTGGSGANRDDL